jgi:hypothetical protein
MQSLLRVVASGRSAFARREAGVLLADLVATADSLLLLAVKQLLALLRSSDWACRAAAADALLCVCSRSRCTWSLAYDIALGKLALTMAR